MSNSVQARSTAMVCRNSKVLVTSTSTWMIPGRHPSLSAWMPCWPTRRDSGCYGAQSRPRQPAPGPSARTRSETSHRSACRGLGGCSGDSPAVGAQRERAAEHRGERRWKYDAESPSREGPRQIRGGRRSYRAMPRRKASAVAGSRRRGGCSRRTRPCRSAASRRAGPASVLMGSAQGAPGLVGSPGGHLLGSLGGGAHPKARTRMFRSKRPKARSSMRRVALAAALSRHSMRSARRSTCRP